MKTHAFYQQHKITLHGGYKLTIRKWENKSYEAFLDVGKRVHRVNGITANEVLGKIRRAVMEIENPKLHIVRKRLEGTYLYGESIIETLKKQMEDPRIYPDVRKSVEETIKKIKKLQNDSSKV